ncbi:MAG TPA: lipocalin family protein [Chitinophagaceae bacterium]|nr:lipocalin family protein [Chitinophagaceae bacterium]HMU57652.1 lipocalin family protein [Chitinophagaceae bacterium]
MKKATYTLFILFLTTTMFAQSPIGKWKIVSYVSEFNGQKFDSHKALLQQRPCAAKIVYEINSNGTYRLNAANSGCDERYIKIQEKLHSEEVWTVKGNKITIGHKKAISVGHTYTFSIKGDIMIWTGTDGEGVITYKKL